MRVHEIDLEGYSAVWRETGEKSGPELATWGSFGLERLHLNFGDGWEGMTVTATFLIEDQEKTMLVDTQGMVDVPPQAMAQPGRGTIVFSGDAEEVKRITADIRYKIRDHSEIRGDAPEINEDTFHQFIEEVGTYRNEAVDAAQKAVDAKNGAEESVRTAVAGATMAEKSANAAAYSASQAKRAEDSARASADAAAESQEAAKLSEEAAESSEVEAGKNATAAEGSQKAAAASEKKAANSEKVAAESASAAANSASAAANNANCAEESAREAASSARVAKESEKSSLESAENAEEAAKRAEDAAVSAGSIAQGQKGYFGTPEVLRQAYPEGQAGEWAIVGSTDSIWVWDADTGNWVDTHKNVDLSLYYNKEQSDGRYAQKTHRHSQEQVDGLKEELNGKAQSNHTHSEFMFMYKALFKVDAWSGSYTQTAAVTPVDGGPPVTMDTVLCSGFGVDDALSAAAYRVQLRAAALLGRSQNKTFGAGTMTLTVTEKPSADAEIYFMAKKGGA